MDRLLRDPRAWGLMLASMLTIMSNATITPSLPGLEAEFPDNPERAALLTRLLITAPSLLVAFIAPFAGALTDRLGRKRPLLAGLLIYAVAGTAGLYLDTLEAILASRLMLGIGVAAIMTSQAALAGDYYEGPERGRLFGYQMAATNIGGLVFVTVAGALAASDPRLPFLIYGLAAVFFPILMMILPEPARFATEEPVIVPGEGEAGWQMIVAVMAIAAGLTFVIFYTVPTQLPYYLHGLGMDDPKNSGYVLGAMMLAAAIMSVISGIIRPRLGRIGTPVSGYILLGAGFAGLGLGHSLSVAMASTALIGAGLGMCMPTFVTTCLNVAPAHRRGLVTGLVTSSIFFGQFLSPLASQPLINHLGYSGTFWIGAAGFAVLALTLTLILRKQAPGPKLPLQAH